MAGVSAPRPSYLRTGVQQPATYQPGYQPPNPNPQQGPPPPTQNYGQYQPVPTQRPTFAPPQTGIDPTNAISSQPDPRIQQLLNTLRAQPNTQRPSGAGSDLEAEIRSMTSAQRNPMTDLQGLTTPSSVRGPDLRSLDSVNVPGPDFSGINTQAAKVRDLLTALASGHAPDIGDINADPAAIAYRTSQDRSVARARTSEAARLGASGATGSGDFDARAAQLAEQAGENTANFTGNLASQRRNEAIQAAETSAGMQLQDLQRQTGAEQAKYGANLTAEQMRREGVAASENARYGAGMDAERLNREGIVQRAELDNQNRSQANSRTDQIQRLLETVLGSERAGRLDAQSAQQFGSAQQQELLRTLLGEQGRVQSQAESSALTAEELRRQEIERGRLYQYPTYASTGQAR